MKNCSIILFNECVEEALDKERIDILNNDLNNLIDIYYTQRRRDSAQAVVNRKRGVTQMKVVETFNPKSFVKKPTTNPKLISRIYEDDEESKENL